MRKKDSENINIKLNFALFVLPSASSNTAVPQKLEAYRNTMNIMITSQKTDHKKGEENV